MKYINPSDLTVAAIGIELANTGTNNSSKQSSMLYFDRSVTFAISVGRIEQGHFRHDVCFINRDADTLAQYRNRGGSASTAIGTEDYFVENTLAGEYTNNPSGFNKHLLRLVAPSPLPPPGPGESDNGIRKNPNTDIDIEYIQDVIEKTIKRADVTISIVSNNLTQHHLITQFPELACIVYPTIKGLSTLPTIDKKIECFPPYCAEIAYKTQSISALKPLFDDEVEQLKTAINTTEWKMVINDLKTISREEKAIPIDFIQLFRSWNIGLNVQIVCDLCPESKKNTIYKKIWNAVREYDKKENYEQYLGENGKSIKGLNFPFIFNSLLGNKFDAWKHGAYLQGKMIAALLCTRMMLTTPVPNKIILPLTEKS